MRTVRRICLAGASIAALATPALAQPTPTTDDTSTEDIIVQARRKGEAIQDVPLTVNAVSAEVIEKLNLRDLKDVASVVPGLTLTAGNRTTGQIVSLRGLAIDTTTSGNNGTVQFYLNDAPVSSGVVLQSLYDVGQIEVLRGPQGTLRGIASPSGSITLTTRRPVMDEFGGFTEGTVTSAKGYKVQAAINLPIVRDLLAIRVAGVADENQGSRVTSVSRPGFEPYSVTRAIRASVRFTPTSSFEANASYSHLLRNYAAFDQVESLNRADPTRTASPLPITARERLAVEDVPTVGRQAYDVYNWQAQWAVAGQLLNYVGNISNQDLQSTEPTDKGDVFGTAFGGDPAASNNNGTYTSLASTINLQNYALASHSYPRSYSHEVRLSSEERLLGLFDYVVGGFMTKSSPWTDSVSVARVNFSGTTLADVTPANFTGLTPTITTRRGRTIERAIFGNLTLHIGDRTEIAGGIRRLNYQENLNTDSTGNRINNSFNATIWSASLKHNFSDNLMAYASAGSSFRVGSGTNALILARNVTVAGAVDPYLQSLLPITPEKSKSYEIGVRSSFLDKRLTINVSAFHQDFTGYIFPASPFYILDNRSGTGTVPNINSSVVLTIASMAAPVPAKVDGIEAEFGFRANRNFSLNGTIAYAKAKMTNAILPCLPPGVTGTPTAAQINPTANGVTQVYTCTVSQSASRSAPLTASLQGEYSRPLGDRLDSFIRGLVSIYGRSTNDAANRFDDVSAYALANIYVGVRAADGQWELSAYARNLFNAFRVTDRTEQPAGVTTSRGTAISTYRVISTTDPREFGITARFAFGSR